MSEKDMILDILYNLKASIADYTKIITECHDLNLRQIFQQIRNEDEQFLYNLYKIAEKKEYYIKPEKATEDNCQNIKIALTKAITQKQGAGPLPSLK